MLLSGIACEVVDCLAGDERFVIGTDLAPRCIEIVLYWNSLRPILGLSGFPQSYFKRLEFRTLVLIHFFFCDRL